MFKIFFLNMKNIYLKYKKYLFKIKKKIFILNNHCYYKLRIILFTFVKKIQTWIKTQNHFKYFYNLELDIKEKIMHCFSLNEKRD